jgi:hypothetical protein
VRRRCGTLLVAVSVLAGFAGGCDDASPPAQPAAAYPAPSPVRYPGADIVFHELGTWSGRGDRQTDSFDVTTGALRLRWEARETAPGAGRLRVTLHSAISGRALQTVVDVQGSGGSAVDFQDEPRVSYLVIESAGVDWKMTLLQGASGPAHRPVP